MLQELTFVMVCVLALIQLAPFIWRAMYGKYTVGVRSWYLSNFEVGHLRAGYPETIKNWDFLPLYDERMIAWAPTRNEKRVARWLRYALPDPPAYGYDAENNWGEFRYTRVLFWKFNKKVTGTHERPINYCPKRL